MLLVKNIVYPTRRDSLERAIRIAYRRDAYIFSSGDENKNMLSYSDTK